MPLPQVQPGTYTPYGQSAVACSTPRHFCQPGPGAYMLKQPNTTMFALPDGFGGAAIGTSSKHTSGGGAPPVGVPCPVAVQALLIWVSMVPLPVSVGTVSGSTSGPVMPE